MKTLWSLEPAVVERIVTVLLVIALMLVARFALGSQVDILATGAFVVAIGVPSAIGAAITRAQVTPVSQLGDGSRRLAATVPGASAAWWINSAVDGMEITLSADADIVALSSGRGACRGLTVVDGGDVAMVLAGSGGATRLFHAVTAGATLMYQVTQIKLAGTTARTFWVHW